MMTAFRVALFSVAFVCTVLPVLFAFPAYVSQMTPTWSYDDDAKTGPSYWYKMPGYGACAGRSQSPINIQRQNAVTLNRDLRIYNYDNYNAEELVLTNDGHTVNVNFNYGTTRSLSRMPYISGGNLNGQYKLINIHFHWGSRSSRGSEHTIDRRRFPIEAHLVHIRSNYDTIEEARNNRDGIAVIGSMYQISSSDNRYLRRLLSRFPSVTYMNQSTIIDRFNIYDVLPKRYEYTYTYFGSLTTPPCSEAVTWNVFENPAPISEAQMRIFRNLQHETQANDPNNNMPIVDNFRPIQDLNGRRIEVATQY